MILFQILTSTACRGGRGHAVTITLGRWAWNDASSFTATPPKVRSRNHQTWPPPTGISRRLFGSSTRPTDPPSTTNTTNSTSKPMIEWTQDTVFPHRMQNIPQLIKAIVSPEQHDWQVANNKKLPRILTTIPQIGTNLNVVHSLFYHDGDGDGSGDGSGSTMQQVADRQAKTNADGDRMLQHLQSRHSSLWVEAPFLKSFPQISGLGKLAAASVLDDDSFDEDLFDKMMTTTSPALYEFRHYQLVLGYDTVPRFLDYYQEGLSSKLQSLPQQGTELVTVFASEVGALNQVVELWRHPTMTAMEEARVAARQATPWKEAIAQIAPLATSFTTSIHTAVG